MSILLGPLSETMSNVSWRDCALAGDQIAGAAGSTLPAANAVIDLRNSRRFMAISQSQRCLLPVPQRSCQNRAAGEVAPNPLTQMQNQRDAVARPGALGAEFARTRLNHGQRPPPPSQRCAARAARRRVRRPAAFASFCSKLQRLPNKEAIDRGFRPRNPDREGKSRPLQTRRLARPLLIRGPTPVRVAGTTPERAAMSTFDNPFDPERRLDRTGCSCGRHRSQAEHDAQLALQCAPIESEDKRYQGVVASAVMRAMFPKDAARRAFLKSVGASTALAALSQLFPLKTATDVFAQGGAIEKKDLKVGFIPITCATPIIMAHPMGFYSKHGLNVEVIKTAGWALIHDKSINKEYDAAHMLSPMPLAITLGVGSNPIPYAAPAIENINGQAITLAVKHKDRRDPKSWKGFKFAVPFDYSMHNYLLRYYVAEHGIDPDQDIQIRAVPPPEMVANLRADNIDGFLGPDPMNQRAVYDGVGFIHVLSKDLWEGHPCCVFAAS